MTKTTNDHLSWNSPFRAGEDIQEPFSVLENGSSQLERTLHVWNVFSQWLTSYSCELGNTDATNGATTQRVLDAIITSLWRRNDVATSFRRHNDVIFASCVRWALTDNTVVVSTNSDLDDPMMNGVQKHQFGRDDPALSSEHLQDVVRIPLRPLRRRRRATPYFFSTSCYLIRVT